MNWKRSEIVFAVALLAVVLVNRVVTSGPLYFADFLARLSDLFA